MLASLLLQLQLQNYRLSLGMVPLMGSGVVAAAVAELETVGLLLLVLLVQRALGS